MATDEELHFRHAYEQLLPEIHAVPSESLAPLIVDITSAVTKGLGALSEIMRFRDQAALLPFFDVAAFDKLEPYALAAQFANTRYLAAADPPAPLPDMIDEAMKLRETLLLDATVLAHRGLINGQKLTELKGAVGHKNVAQDIMTLAETLRANYDAIASKTAVTVADLNRAEILAHRILVVVGEREQGPASATVTADIRHRAYTLFAHAYEEVRHAIRFLRRKEGDVDEIAPSLFAGKAAPSRKPEPEAPAAEPTAAVAPPTNGHAAAPVAPGMPGADPFNRA
jgi:hypothetical protein